MADLEPLDPRLRALFADAQSSYTKTSSTAEEALHTFEQRMLLSGLSTMSTGARVAGAAAPGASPASVGAAIGKGAGLGKASVVIAVVAFSAGALVGRLTVPTKPPASMPLTAPSESAQATSTATIPVVPTATLLPTPSASTDLLPPPKVPSTTPTGTSTTMSSSSLAAERDLIDTTRSALSRGRADDALASIQTHATRFPNGSLAEEREALAVQALVLAGRQDAANERGARFHRRYPKSIFGGSVDAILRTNPPK